MKGSSRPVDRTISQAGPVSSDDVDVSGVLLRAAVVLGLLAAPAVSHAAQVIEDPALHEAQLAQNPGSGVPWTLGFEELALGTSLGNQYTSQGLGFQSPVGVWVLPEAFGTPGIGSRLAVAGFDPLESPSLTLQFDEPQQVISGWFVDAEGALEIEGRLAGYTVEEFSLPGPEDAAAEAAFRGIWFDGFVDEVVIVAHLAEDGFGLDLLSVAELGSVDNDGDGWSDEEGDCDDSDSSVSPDAPELCGGVDLDCDGIADDLDGDGWNPCDGDCDDTDPTVYPTAEEACDGADNDCDGLVDESPDADGDGWTVCEGDCDDDDASVFPGQGCDPPGDDDDVVDDDDDTSSGDDDDTSSGDDDDTSGADDDDTSPQDDDDASDDDDDDDDDSDDDDADADDDDGGGIEDLLPGIAGGGCECGLGGPRPGPSLLLLLLLAPLLARRRRGGSTAGAAVAALALSIVAQPALAEPSTAVDTVRFRPTSSRDGGVLLEAVGVGGPWELDGGIWLGFARRPVMLTLDGDPTDPVVSARLAGVVHGGFNFGARVRVGVALPVALYQAGEHPETGEALSSGGVGDLRLLPQVMILDPERTWLGLSLSAPISFPTGDAGGLLGESGPSIQPRVAAEKRFELPSHRFLRFSVGLEAGWLFRPRTELLDLDSAGEFTFAVGGRWMPSETFRLGTEVVAGIGEGANARRGEWVTWARVSPGRVKRFDVVAGVAVGLGRGVGTPEGRLFAGLRVRLDPRARVAVTEVEGDDGGVSIAAQDPGPQPPLPGESEAGGWGLRLVDRTARIESSVLFDFDEARLKPAGRALLVELARWLDEHGGAGPLEIAGHCDESGSAVYNLDLSRRRAESVREALVRAGIPEERLTARGYGETRPVMRRGQAPIDVVDAANRRVEFRFLGVAARRADPVRIR